MELCKQLCLHQKLTECKIRLKVCEDIELTRYAKKNKKLPEQIVPVVFIVSTRENLFYCTDHPLCHFPECVSAFWSYQLACLSQEFVPERLQSDLYWKLCRSVYCLFLATPGLFSSRKLDYPQRTAYPEHVHSPVAFQQLDSYRYICRRNRF